MKTMEREILDDEDLRTVELLTKCGCGNSEARCLCYLLSHKEGTTKDIESAMDLRQPEASVGLAALFDKGLVSHKKIPSRGKGRPTQKYILDKKEAVHKKLKSVLLDTVNACVAHMNDLDMMFSEMK